MIKYTSLVLAALLLSGCASMELSSVRGDLARQVPEARFSAGTNFTLGPVSMGLVRTITRWAGVDSPEAHMVLSGVRRVSVARYDVTGTFSPTDLRMPARLRRYMDNRGWEHLATYRSDDEAVWVLYRARRGTIRDLFVTVLSDDQLVMTRISGDLSGIVMELMENRELPGW